MPKLRSTTLKPLQPPDSLHLRAAQGWLELGNHLEANAELEKIAARRRAHPDVLETRWGIYAQAKDWRACCDIAAGVIKTAPERASGWIHRSFALHELKRTQEAWDNLFAVAERFPKEATIPYNLACYAAQLGKLWESQQWLKQAFKIGDAKELKLMALDDTDLKPLWDKIGEL